MGKISRKKRQCVIKQKKQKREKINRLKEKLLASGTKLEERQSIIAKIKKLSLFYPIPDELAKAKK